MNEGMSYFFAGDVTYDEQALLDHKLQGPSMALSSHPQTINRILQYVQSTPTVYLPAHDWKSGERFAARQTVNLHAVAEAVC
jgi:glyoxylase-like metal-dependent hydrolase (beta-lactamase superfamily II)